MKYIFFSLFLGLILISSCTNKEADIFDMSAAERLNKALVDDKNALIAAPNGWVMEYFATTQSKGYTLFVKFNASGSAVVSSKSELTLNSEFQTDTCLYEMIGDNGPVLTFNTFNKVLHRFSTPENPDGAGLEGDYEFVVMSTSADKIVLKGKKRGVTVILTKAPSNVTWLQYATEIDQMDSLLFSAASPKLTMTVGTSTYSFSNGYSHIFTIVKNGGSDNVSFDAPFIVNRTGIRLQTAQTIEGNEIQTFTLSADKAALVCVEKSDLKLIGTQDLAAYFSSNTKTWEMIPTELSTNVKSIYNQIVQSCVSKYNAQNIKLAIKYYLTRQTYVLSLSFESNQTLNEGNMDLGMGTTGVGALAFTSKGSGDVTGLDFYNNLSGYKEMVNLVASSFTLSTASALNPRKITFTKKADTNTWFSLLPR